MPRILLNTTTLKIGGALQNSVNFLIQILQNPAEFTWNFAISKEVADNVQKTGITLPVGTEVFPITPARDKKERARLFEIANRLKPDAIFTFNGPAYVKFKQPHLLGCTNPWVTHVGLNAYRALSFPIEWGRYWLEAEYKKYWFKFADAWVMQTESSRQGLHRRLGIPLEKVHVVSNSCGAGYFEDISASRPFPEPGQKVRIFCFSAFYKHKNFSVLPAIAAELKALRPNLDFEIVLTLPPGKDWNEIDALAKKLNVSEQIINHGPVPVMQGPAVYKTCDLVLLPTLLETFSATYPEAMTMGLPIVTSDLDFARDTCGDAALFFPPRDASAGAEAVARLLSDRALWNDLIARGKSRLPLFPTPLERCELNLGVIRKMLATRP